MMGSNRICAPSSSRTIARFEVAVCRATRDRCRAVRSYGRCRPQYPHVPSRLLLVGEPPYPNAKVWSLHHMTEAARHDLLVMSDSDIRVTPDFLRTIAAEFQDPKLGVSTCPYRAVPGRASGRPWKQSA